MTKTTAYAIATISFVLIVGLVLYLNITVIRDNLATQQLQDAGVVTQGTVLSAQELNPGTRATYRVTMRFTPQGGALTTFTRRVDFSTYATAKNSGLAQVRYLPGRPESADIVGNDLSGNNLIWLIVVDVFFLGAVIWLVRALIRERLRS